MNLRTRLLVAQLPLFAALALLGAISLVSLTRLGAGAQSILRANYRSVLAMQRLGNAVERIDDAAALYPLTGDRAAGSLRAAPHAAVLERELTLEEGNITESGEREMAQRLRARWETARRLLSELQKTEDRRAARELYASSLSPAFEAIRASADEILGINQDAMVRKSERARVLAERLRALVLVGAIGATAAALLVAAVLTRRAVRPLLVLQQAVRRVGEGDLEARARLAGSDEIAKLGEDFNAMAESLHRYRKSSLGELLLAQQAAQAAIDSLPEPVILFGVKGEVLSLNRAAEDLLGAVGTVSDLEPELRAAVLRILEHVLGGRGSYAPRGIEEVVRFTSSGGDRYLLPNANPLHDEDGITIGVTAVLQDVTRFKRFDELKDDRVSTVAHEFRTPLTSMRMAIHLCLEETVGPLTAKQADLLCAAREDCERLQTLVDDLLDLSRLQTGRVPLNAEPFAASSLVSQALGRHRSAAEGRSVTLIHQPTGEDAPVLADPDRIALVFDNLITNALRYTPAGGVVELRARRETGRVRFEVIDTGPGIPEVHRARLFDRMYQVPGTEGGSVGLGLAIAKEIVLGHGGEIGVESEPGRGSTFWFTLPEAKST
ncbi:MAG: HAMP domain-containing protein [Deltaproteobacteria bacterium]|nr:HAMP domain-containing protein [Deltaproteobacteria bacterium]